MTKEYKMFTVRNARGQSLGTYRRATAQQAITAFKDDQLAYFSTFRTRLKPGYFDGLTATAEEVTQ